MDNTRSIVGAVLQSGRIYKAGDEEALAGVLPRADTARLVEKVVLTGDWGTGEMPESTPAPVRAKDAPPAKDAAGNEPIAPTPEVSAPQPEKGQKTAKPRAPKSPKEAQGAKPPKSSTHAEK